MEDIPVNLRGLTSFDGFLQRIGRLSKLQVKSNAISSALGNIRIQIQHNIGLIDAEAIAEHIVGPQVLDPPDRMVEIVLVVPVEHVIQRGPSGQQRRQRRRRRRTLRRRSLAA